MRQAGILLALALAAGCSPAERAHYGPWRLAADYKVTWAAGATVRTWVSNGPVQSEAKSDGYYFIDKVTGKIVEVSGNVCIEQL